MSTPHNSAEKGNIAQTVLMPGDPLRAKWIAETYLENAELVSDVRNVYCYTGIYKGKQLSVMASGMGMPSMGIYSYELYKFYDVENIIRIGSAGAYTKKLNLMDVVLADVPCSGYGIIRKKPDIRYKDPDDMARLPELQLRILNKQAEYVKPGGVLMYSTCTLLKRENEAVVEAFLRSRKDFYLEKLTLPSVFPKNTTGMLTLIPGQYDTDGFFICRMRRKA